jgi:germination protein M
MKNPGKKREVLLYFSDADGEYLVAERREIIEKGELEEEAKETMNELIKGPKGKLFWTLPRTTRLIGLRIDKQGVAKVDFSKALTKDHPGGSSAEMMILYSIVNSLTVNFPQIKRVQILIEGKFEESIAGHISIREPFSRNAGLIKAIGTKGDT